MDYRHYLSSYRSNVYLKPDSISLKNIPNKFIVYEHDKPLVSGMFVMFDKISKGKEGYYGRINEFYFIDKSDRDNYSTAEDKSEFMYKIMAFDIIYIEIIFDEIAYSS